MSNLERGTFEIEAGGRRRRRRRRRRPSVAGSCETATDGSHFFSDTDDDRSWHSVLDSTAGASGDECRSSEIEGVPDYHRGRSRGESCSFSECVSDEEEKDLESGELKVKSRPAKQERDCRICHLNLVREGGEDQECGIAIELGCSCKGDLGAAHKQCAETWFKIKGNTTCEICGDTALNIPNEQINASGSNNVAGVALPPPPAPALVIPPETRSFWHGRRIMNFLLACMVFAFVISWLFHFNVLP